METKNKSVMIRRFVAIGLMALSILFLFWPSVVVLNGDSEAWESYTDRMRFGKSDFADDFAREYKNRIQRQSSDKVSDSDLAAAKKTGKEVYDLMKKDNYNASIFKLRTLLPNWLKYEGDSDARIVAVVLSVVLNVLIFATLAFAIAAIPMMLFNKSKVFNVLHVVFTFILATCFLLFGFLGVIAEAIPDTGLDKAPLSPGVAAFLLPAFSLAALIVYRREKGTGKAAKAAPQPVYAAQPTYPQQPVYPQQPADNAWTQQAPSDQPAFWTCPNCGTKCAITSKFCINCGTKRP